MVTLIPTFNALTLHPLRPLQLHPLSSSKGHGEGPNHTVTSHRHDMDTQALIKKYDDENAPGAAPTLWASGS